MDPRLRSTTPNPDQLTLPIGPAVASARRERLRLIPAPPSIEQTCRACGKQRAMVNWRLCPSCYAETFGVELRRRTTGRAA